MTYLKWAWRIVFWGLVVAFFHYTLPQHDIVRITDTYSKRVDLGVNSYFYAQGDAGGASGATNRDVFFIQTKLPDGDVMVYRNEDTGWGWPPYFKFDTANLQAEAGDLVSKQSDANPQWVIVKHYGWRNEWFSIFPNALSVAPATGPDQQIIPWGNIIILTILFAIFWAIRVRWIRFRKARIDPVVEQVGDGIDDMTDGVTERTGRLARWFGRK